MKLLDIAIYTDKVIIEGQEVKRPSTFSPSQWRAVWESIDGRREGQVETIDRRGHAAPGQRHL